MFVSIRRPQPHESWTLISPVDCILTLPPPPKKRKNHSEHHTLLSFCISLGLILDHFSRHIFLLLLYFMLQLKNCDFLGIPGFPLLCIFPQAQRLECHPLLPHLLPHPQTPSASSSSFTAPSRPIQVSPPLMTLDADVFSFESTALGILHFCYILPHTELYANLCLLLRGSFEDLWRKGLFYLTFSSPLCWPLCPA